ncbi:MAG TPA: alpha/beta hydrolase domain-containing protein [Alphaproteobacteria bacterium]|jgi:hypothetical protein|nr:alpha/beta hydrolase domain-containing protein [Alphaproteobacteria bacterium]
MAVKLHWALLVLALMAPSIAARAADVPTVTGPITGGAHGRPFGASLADLTGPAYVEEEYFIAGTATAYDAAKPLGTDGVWSVMLAGTQPYKTRILVRRPKDLKRFNGTVVLEWQNVSGGFDVDAEWGYAYPALMRAGYVWVGVSAQHAGVMGPPLRAGFSQPLTLWDAERYGSLSVPNDDFSFDIFTQAARLLGPHRPLVLPDPLAGLKVVRIIGIGASQSANRLATYVDGVQPLANVLDGILIASRIGVRGGAAPLKADGEMPDPVKIRPDLKIPVLVVETESDAISHYPARTPDSAHYRLWEMAGTAHQNAWADEYFGAEIKRDLGGVGGLGGCDRPVNDLPTQHVQSAAIHALDRWVRTGKAPVSSPLIAISGSPAMIERDELGNAKGGFRLPGIAVPVAVYGGLGTPEHCRIEGFTVPLDQATLKRLYPDHAAYVGKVKEAARAAEKAGFLLAPEAAAEVRKAEAAKIP